MKNKDRSCCKYLLEYTASRGTASYDVSYLLSFWECFMGTWVFPWDLNTDPVAFIFLCCVGEVKPTYVSHLCSVRPWGGSSNIADYPLPSGGCGVYPNYLSWLQWSKTVTLYLVVGVDWVSLGCFTDLIYPSFLGPSFSFTTPTIRLNLGCGYNPWDFDLIKFAKLNLIIFTWLAWTKLQEAVFSRRSVRPPKSCDIGACGVDPIRQHDRETSASEMRSS